jgi:hypothetical protein
LPFCLRKASGRLRRAGSSARCQRSRRAGEDGKGNRGIFCSGGAARRTGGRARQALVAKVGRLMTTLSEKSHTAAKARSTASGARSMILSSTRLGPAGVRLCCSQSFSVASGTRSRPLRRLRSRRSLPLISAGRGAAGRLSLFGIGKLGRRGGRFAKRTMRFSLDPVAAGAQEPTGLAACTKRRHGPYGNKFVI